MRPLLPLLLLPALLLCACTGAGPSAGHENALRPSGLHPVFMEQARCPDIASPFGSPTRYDGSPRPPGPFGGRHGGIDISLPEGTPLLAIAAGEVIGHGEGGRLEGLFIWLRHAPEDTGLDSWVFSKYQHLRAAPGLAPGSRVTAGEVIAHSGRSGTMGGHYGAAGYPHLHLTTIKHRRGDLALGHRGAGMGGELVDPLQLYRDAGVRVPGPLSDTVIIPWTDSAGHTRPQDSLLVWPVACEPGF